MEAPGQGLSQRSLDLWQERGGSGQTSLPRLGSLERDRSVQVIALMICCVLSGQLLSSISPATSGAW